MNKDLTEGNINRRLLGFALPLMAGNLLQQFYNIADTWAGFWDRKHWRRWVLLIRLWFF